MLFNREGLYFIRRKGNTVERSRLNRKSISGTLKASQGHPIIPLSSASYFLCSSSTITAGLFSRRTSPSRPVRTSHFFSTIFSRKANLLSGENFGDENFGDIGSQDAYSFPPLCIGARKRAVYAGCIHPKLPCNLSPGQPQFLPAPAGNGQAGFAYSAPAVPLP